MIKLPRKILAWLIPSLCLLFVVSAVFRSLSKEKGFHFKEFAALPVVSNGRVQPLDSLARNALLAIVGKQRVPGDDVPESPAAWLAELAYKPEIADDRRIFLIHHDEILGLTGLTRGEEKTYSYTQILPSFPALQPEARRIGAKEAQTRPPYEKALIRLTRNLGIYNQLKHALGHPGLVNAETEFASLADSSSPAMPGLRAWASFTETFSVPSGKGEDGWRKLPDSVIELFYRNAIGTAVAAIVGFATLLIAHHLSLSGDTLEMMRAVLDTNFWLATHVVVITLGYSATFLAGTIAIFFIFRRLFGTIPKETVNSLRGMVYGVLCFATLASFVGTVLGGIWADQSWGRFWGWDPKENGALLIVIWNAIILHARWGGMVKERGMMVMAIFGNIVTSWSWFGTNMLGIGLHYYGFTDAAFVWLTGFIISQVVIMLLAFIPVRSRALQNATLAN
ncbi:MAG: cytochrome c biogenesis protein CcsA [Verrucomicrobia bacterium]|jgi:hypothetical protein|nr:cytochrome c biogenesis protein CcsA [Verrucomicrobiota bacterium]